ncbi:lysophospholipid acyltransferase family protein [Penaeicola halotolerans]|uniref:lysophospholipid acyltransferase family protein n=1 Tax=Penaeicola halotolerans TaxID=2793196 RepID=UPI001CF84EDA|nr:lysophospholipid acyltransferase family protein [Penaeicola halotolerans]
MKYFVLFFKILFLIWTAVWFVFWMILFSPFMMIPILISDRAGRFSFIFIRLWATLWGYMSGIRFKTYGKEVINLSQPYIYTINHTSYLDAPAIPAAVPQQLRALGKHELGKIPLFGWIVGRFAVWVDRTNPASRLKSIDKLKNVLAKGISILIAPEGTRNNTKNTLLPFKNGAFKLAIETQTPILPMVILHANKLMPRGTFFLKPGVISIYFSEPIPVSGLSLEDVDQLKEKVYNRMEAMILTHE